ncbi:MAG: endonuclease/exonuclease/phosphatase family protein [Gemmataceae bacterium]
MPGLSVLFWNLNAQPLAPRVGRLAASLSADVVILAECETTPAVVSRALNAAGASRYGLAPGCGEKLRVFTRLPAGAIQPLTQDPLEAWLGFALEAPTLPSLILFVAHLPSKLWSDTHDQLLASLELAQDIAAEERRASHSRTMVVGDLNANPFEPSVVWAGGLHALMTKELAAMDQRTIRKREYPVFYNPMWGVFGDTNPGQPGTFFRVSSASVNYFWNTYDQVLLRPDLMNRLGNLQILDTDGTDSLLRDGRPDTVAGSDHLPLYFRLDW